MLPGQTVTNGHLTKAVLLTNQIRFSEHPGYPQRTGPHVRYMRVHSRPRASRGGPFLGVCPAFACPPREPDLRLPFAHVHCTVHCSSHSDYKGLSSWWRGRYSPCVMQDKDLTHARYHLTRYQVTVSLSEGRAKVGSNAMVVRVPCVRLACCKGQGNAEWRGT